MTKTVVKICSVCGSHFEVVRKRGAASRKVCSEQCRKKRDDEIKKLSNAKIKPLRYAEATELSKEWNIPIHTILTYGIKFLKDNPAVVEVLQAGVKLSGHYRYLTDEEKEIRKRAVERENNRKQRERKGYDSKICVVCGSEFTHQFRSTRAITCSDECSKVRYLSKARECSERYRNKLKNADDYQVTNINGLINVACDNPELFDRLVRAIKDNEYAKFDLSAYASERIEDLGL